VQSPLDPVFPTDPVGTARPAAFVTPEGGQPVLDVELTLSDAEAGAEYVLEGRGRGPSPLFLGRARSSASGPQGLRFLVSLDHAPTVFTALRDESVSWELSKIGAAEPLGAVPLPMELYFLPADPGRFFPKGVPVESLRQTARSLGVRADGFSTFADTWSGTRSERRDHWQVIEHVVASGFGHTPPNYDVWHGRTFYTDYLDFNHVTLYYRRYLAAQQDPNSICNCYDKAAVLQHELSAIGVTDVKFAYIVPFGYLRKTDLIGRGACNNPFYGDDVANKIVPTDAPDRTAFGNHAFCYIEGTQTVADACSGPHTGTESPGSYVDVATDDQTPSPAAVGAHYVKRGRVGNIGYFQGVTQFRDKSRSPEAAMNPHSMNLEALKKEVGYDDSTAVARGCAPPPLIARRWPDPRECPAVGRDWKLSFEEVVPGFPESHRYWHLRKGDQTLKVTIYVASDGPETAHRRFLWLGSAHQAVGPVFRKGPGGLGEYSAEVRGAGHAQYLWVDRNVVFNLTSANSQIDLETLARWLQHIAVIEDANAPQGPPVIAAVTADRPKVKVGEVTTLDVQCDPRCLVDFVRGSEGLKLIQEDGHRLTFLAGQAGKGEVVVVAVDPETLLAAEKRVDVEVS